MNFIQIRIEFLDYFAVLCAVFLFADPSNFAFYLARSRIGVGDSTQLVQPAQNLAVCQGYNFVVPAGLREREREIPFGLAQAAAVNLEYVFLTN